VVLVDSRLGNLEETGRRIAMASKSKFDSRNRRHRSIRKRLSGTAERPRLVVYRSARHIYAQIIDDLSKKTLFAASDLMPKKDPSAEAPKGKKRDRAKQVGVLVAKKCLEKGISQVVFDRAGYRYHGRVSSVATGAREAGLKF
jgi:large subunit ribosomal protein L18